MASTLALGQNQVEFIDHLSPEKFLYDVCTIKNFISALTFCRLDYKKKKIRSFLFTTEKIIWGHLISKNEQPSQTPAVYLTHVATVPSAKMFLKFV